MDYFPDDKYDVGVAKQEKKRGRRTKKQAEKDLLREYYNEVEKEKTLLNNIVLDSYIPRK